MAVRKTTFKGKTLEELQGLGLEEFSKLVNASARRTITRNNYRIKNFLKKLESHDWKKPFRTHVRDAIILPSMVGKTFEVYNGKDWIKFTVKLPMLGHRLGEYSHTTKQVRHSGPGIGATRGSKSVELK
jgi:small subunit ribosomal protein S19